MSSKTYLQQYLSVLVFKRSLWSLVPVKGALLLCILIRAQPRLLDSGLPEVGEYHKAVLGNVKHCYHFTQLS